MKTSNRRYPLYVCCLLFLTLLAASQPLAAGALLPAALDWLSGRMDEAPHRSMLFIAVLTALLLLLAAVVYALGLKPYADCRPRIWVLLNAACPPLFTALAFTANEASSALGMGWRAWAAWGAVPILPLLVLAGEWFAFRTFHRLAESARLRDWRRTAIKFYRWCLRLRPERLDLLRLSGLLHAEEDNYPQAIALLERLGPPERSEDDQVLRGLEAAYRAEGYLQDALNCLLRLRQLRLDAPGLDRRILDDQVKLGLYAEALALIESGRLKNNFALQMIRQNLEMKLGRYEAALATTNAIAAQEPPPQPHAMRLLAELADAQPHALEPRIALGRLLLAGQDLERRVEGARLLEQALSMEPHRLDLARELLVFYRETQQPEPARHWLETIAAGGDPDPEIHSELARLLTDEGRLAEAEAASRHWLALSPGFYRAHLRLGRVLFLLDRLDEAEAELRAAEPDTPAEHAGWVSHLRNDIELKRRDLRLSELQAASQNAASREQQLGYFSELLTHGRIEQAFKLSEELLAAQPDLRTEIADRLRACAEHLEKNFRVLDYLADLYFEDGRMDELLEVYRRMAERSMHPELVLQTGCEKILSRVPNHLEARLELALARRARQDWAGVIEVMDPLMRNGTAHQPPPPAMDPPDLFSAQDEAAARLHDDATPLAEAADKALWVEAAFRLGRIEEAISTGLELARELESEPGFMLLLIDALQAANRHQEAAEVYQRARHAAPDDPRLARLARRIAVNRRTQRLEQLQAKAGQAGGLEPHEHYEKAELHREIGQIGEAIIHYQRAADEEDLAVLALAKMAVSLSDKGMYDMAEEILNPLPLTREIEIRHPELKELFYSVARSLEKIKRPDLAIKYYKKIFRVDAAYRDIVTRLERLGT